MNCQDLQVILDHFEEPVFPRTISTKTTSGRQVEVESIEEAHARFKQANFTDCRINAYPAYTNYNGFNRQPPNFVMCDLDAIKFRTEKLLLKTLHHTTENIARDLGCGTSTVLFTGNGYHVYRPLQLPVLESESIFARFQNPSTEFIRYAAQRWTEGKNDPSNHPSVNSCMLRVPGSINSKNNKVVEVVELWDKTRGRPIANSMLFDFYIKLAAKEFALRFKQQRQQQKKKDHYHCYVGNRFIERKNYMHFGYTNNTTPVQEIDWIEGLLKSSGISDCRQLTIDLVLAPYLVNIKKYDYDTAYNIIVQWLDRCGQKKPLGFTARRKVNYALNRSRREGMRPMKLNTMKEDYADMYEEILKNKTIY